MNILFTRFPLESAYGGAEKQTLSLMEGLRGKGHEVSFMGNCPVLLKEGMRHKVQDTRLDIGTPPVTKWGALSFFWRAPFIRQKFRQYLVTCTLKLDAIVMLSLTEKLLLTDIAVKHGIKVFWIEHDPIGRWLTMNPWLPLLRKQSRLATTITVSEMSRKQYVEMGWKGKVVAIANGMESEKTQDTRHKVRNLSLESHHLHLGCVARLAHEKGIDLLINATKDLPDVSLTIVGKGPQESFLRSLINESTNQRINLIAHMENLAEFFSSIDALVLPSRSDPFGMVAAEAMMAGVPVIVTDACGIAGYLQDGKDAIVVKADSGLALREGVERLKTQDTRLKIGESGKKTSNERFAVERMVDEYEKVFRM